MAELKARPLNTVVYQLGCAAGAGVRWKRTMVPTLESDAAICALAARLGFRIDDSEWLVDDAGSTEMERSEGQWRPVVRALAAPGGVGQVPTMEESLAAFVRHVLPMDRGTGRKHATHCLTVLTRSVWKSVIQDLLPMSADALRAFIQS
jgi:hypothetical protein